MAVSPLAALIEECQMLFLRQHDVELSYGDIARRSKHYTRQRIQQLAKNPVKRLPDPEGVAALSLGLGVPESVVRDRWLASVGHSPGDYALAGPERRGRPIQVRKDEAEPDPNVDPDPPEYGA
jgi:hypothetical protein